MFKKSKRSQIRQRARNHSDSEGEDSFCKNNDNKQNDSLAGNAKQEIPKLAVTEINFSINESSQSNESSINDIRSVDQAVNSTTKKAAKLSFHNDEDEEEEDVFKVKKSVYSKRMERNKMKILKSSNSTSTVKIKQQFVDEINGCAAKQEPLLQKKEVDVEELTVVENQNENDNDIVICPGSDDDENEETQFVPRRTRPAAGQMHEFINVIERGTIPDAKVIYELKKQRQKLARTINEDFIALNSDEEETLRQESRLHRDDDGEADDTSDGDDEDEEERIQFGKVDYKTKEREKAMEAFRMAQQDKEALEQQKRKEASSEDSEYSDDDQPGQSGGKQSDDSEDELDRWEREQIRKAVCLPSLHSYNEIEFQNRFLQNEKKSTVAASSRPHCNDNHNVIPIEIDDDDAAPKRFGLYIPAYISSINRREAENDYESVNNRKSDFRRRLESSLEDNKQLLYRVEMDARLIKQSIDEFQCRENAFLEDAQF